MRYFIQGHGDIDLSDQDFVAQGGEGKIYAKEQWIYKIYGDPAHMPPAAKFRELAALDRPNIVRPQDLVLDRHGVPLGFRMARVAQSVPLARLFTNDFRSQRRIQESAVLRLLEAMQDTIAFIHSRQCLLVDGNEMNYLVDEGSFTTPYFIDVDSYQTPGFPATAIMPTIRDYHTPGFSPLSDWFAFAVVACQVLVGIHPYKGKHPRFKKGDLQARMQANVSIFNPEVSVPAATRDFGVIPPAWRDWFKRLFERGERLPPPALGGARPVPALPRQAPQGTAQLRIDLLREYPAEIRAVTAWQGVRAVFWGDQVEIGQQTFALPQPQTQVVFAPKSLAPLLADVEHEALHITDLETGQRTATGLKASHLLRVDNRLYALYRERLTALKITEYADKRLVGPGTSWSVLPHAAQVLDGLVYENVLGRPYLAVPYGDACWIREVPELAGYKIVGGAHEHGVVMLVGYRQGRYDLLCLRFDEHYRTYRASLSADLDHPEINFTVLDNGVVAHIPHDGELTVFQRHGDSARSVQDPAVRSDMRLAKDGTQVLFYTGNKLYRMQMK